MYNESVIYYILTNREGKALSCALSSVQDAADSSNVPEKEEKSNNVELTRGRKYGEKI
jgi:hypothetical protein